MTDTHDPPAAHDANDSPDAHAGPPACRPLVVALVLDRLRGVGGAGLSLAEHAEQLVEAGHRVHVITHHTDKNPDVPGCTMHRTTLASYKNPRLLPQVARWIASLHREHRFDVVHSFGPYLPCNVYENRGGVYAIHARRQIDRYRNPWRRRWRALRAGIDGARRRWLCVERGFFAQPRLPRLVAISELAAEWIEQFYGVGRERITVLPNTVPAFDSSPSQRQAMRQKWRTELGLSPETPCLAFVGQVFKHKGLGFAIDALARYIRGAPSEAVRPHLVAAGRDDPAPFHRQVRRLGLGKRVHLLGLVKPIEPVYRLADALIYPTIADSFSRVIAEALQAELPVITTRWAGAASLIAPGVNGFVVDEPWSIDALAESIGQVCDPARRAELARHSGDRFDQLPRSVAQRTARLVDIYRQAADDDPMAQRLAQL